MTRTILALALAALGAGLVIYGVVLRRGAAEELREASFRSVSRTRALDEIERSGAEARTLASWIAEAESREEREVLRAVAACSRDMSCAGPIEAAREHYAEALGAASSRSSSENDRADWLTMLGALAMLLGVLLALQRRPPKATPPDAPGPSRVEAILKQRLEDLYAARKRAWDSERFAAYGELAAGLSHGLKTPLASMRAAAQVARKKMGADHPAADQIDDVIDEIDALVAEVKRFLSATGTGEPVPSRIPPAQLVQAIEKDYASDARERRVALEAKTSEDLPTVLVDAALVEMALRNLVENALAAAAEGTTVCVSAGLAPPPARAGLDNAKPDGGDWIEIAVRDEGSGIPPEVLGSRGVVSKKPGGSGLGLAIARRIVERHGGALLVETAPNKGTTVRLVLPVAKERAA